MVARDVVADVVLGVFLQAVDVGADVAEAVGHLLAAFLNGGEELGEVAQVKVVQRLYGVQVCVGARLTQQMDVDDALVEDLVIPTNEGQGALEIEAFQGVVTNTTYHRAAA